MQQLQISIVRVGSLSAHAPGGFVNFAVGSRLTKVPVNLAHLGQVKPGSGPVIEGPALCGRWGLHPQVVESIWVHFGQGEVDLFASQDTVPHGSQCSSSPLAKELHICNAPFPLFATGAGQDERGKNAGNPGHKLTQTNKQTKVCRP